MQNMIGRRR